MPLNYKTETVHTASSIDVERFVKENLSKSYFNVVVDQGFVLKRDARVIEVDVVDTGLSVADHARIIKWQQGMSFEPCGEYLIEPILSQLSQMGHIPAGKWYITIE